MEAAEGREPFVGRYVDLCPVPAAHAEGLELLLQALQPGSVVLLLRALQEDPAVWLSLGRITHHLRHVLMEPIQPEVWPLLPDAWAIAMRVPEGVEHLGSAIQIHAVRQALLARLESEWRAASGTVAIAEPGVDAVDPEVYPPLFSLFPVAALNANPELQSNIEELNTLLEIILNKRLHAQFQPIVSLRDGQLFGFEALIRGPKGTLLRRSGAMIRAAVKARMVSWFDLACQEQCFLQAAEQGLKHLLFVNLDAEGLASLADHDRPLAVRARDSGLTPDRIVIEITERQTVDDFPRLMSDIARLREEGFKIAIDDAGAGYNSLHTIAEIRPEFIKIDRNLVRNLDVNGERRGMLAALVRYARQIGTAVLGEGAETREELATLIDLGVTYAQGYILGKPTDALRGVSRETREFIRQRAERRMRMAVGQSLTVGQLMRKGMTVSLETPLAEVARSFARNPSLTSAVVVVDGCVRGLLMRQSLEHVLHLAKKARADGLLPGEAVASWMQTNVLYVMEDTPASETAWQATCRSDISLETDIVILTDGDAYAGVLPMRALLEAVATQQQSGRRYADPLSGLPNRVVLEQALQQRLAARQSVGLVRADIVKLEPYNRCFDPAHGDEMITALALLLRETVEREGDKEDLLTHLGGDNFVLITRPERVAGICRALVAGFRTLLPQFYPVEQVRLGYTELREPDGVVRRVPLCSLAVAGLTGRKSRLLNAPQAMNELYALLRTIPARPEGQYAIN